MEDAKKCADRNEVAGPAGMVARSSRPRSQPNRTPMPAVRKIVHLRWKQRADPVEIGDRLGIAPSTVHAVPVRCRLNRLSDVERAAVQPIRCYEYQRPGDLLHMDVKRLARPPTVGAGATSDANKANVTAPPLPPKPAP